MTTRGLDRLDLLPLELPVVVVQNGFCGAAILFLTTALAYLSVGLTGAAGAGLYVIAIFPAGLRSTLFHGFL